MASSQPLPKTPITHDELIRTNVAMLVLTSVFIVARAALQVSRRKPVEMSDGFIYFSFALYIALWTLYFFVVPPMFRVYAVVDRVKPPYKTMADDAATMLRLITAAQMCFYTLLFSVKLSLLALYRKLLAGLPSMYRKIWWCILAFCVIVSVH